MAKRPSFIRASRTLVANATFAVFLWSTPVGALEREVDLSTSSDGLILVAEDAGDRFGVRATHCDVNGDGILDLVLGADGGDGPTNSVSAMGEAYVVLGRHGSWSAMDDIADVADTVVFGEEQFDSLGRTVICGDVNGDGFDDLLLGARQANGPANDRPAAGQVHIVFGRAEMPATIDLALEAAPVIWGAEADHLIGSRFAAGDINGDGFADLILGTGDGRDRTGLIFAAGRVYIVFGQAQWPSGIDLASEADLIIYGDTENDFLGDSTGSADLDGDGLAEVIAVAPLGDGAFDARQGAGDVHVWYGRVNWPAEIDLATSTADMLVFGPDEGDRIVQTGTDLRFGDTDSDGLAEMVAGANLSYGAGNDGYATGEGLVFEPGTIFPGTADLATDRDAVVYGRQPGDRACTGVQVGDVDGDGVHDFVCGAAYAAGPQDSRVEGGEIYVIRGGSSFSGSVDLAMEQADLIIFGRAAGERERLVALGDLNGDGLFEMVTNARENAGQLYRVTLTSPYDTDGDGVTQLADNCPLVANPLQDDLDGDRIGDACQGDYDGDGLIDEDDCAPRDAGGGTPDTVTGLSFDVGSSTLLLWAPAAFSDLYDISRGLLSSLDGTDYGACENESDPDRGDTRFEDPDQPSAGAGFFYLIRGVNGTCELAGTYGLDSSGIERVNTNPSGCS